MKIKKQHRKKKYLHKLNRKRMHNNLRNTGKISCKVVQEVWNNKLSTNCNLRNMGLVSDPNKAIKIPNYKQEQIQRAKGIDRELSIEDAKPKYVPRKKHVVEELEKEAKAPRERRFMLPKSQVEYITYLLDKYGHDYKAMAKDKKNYYQDTWKQLRAKIKTFMGIPAQYSEYLKSRGLLDKEEDEEELRKEASALVMEDSE
ncbi:Nucleolar protein 16 [Eumeta japonica]|uniref:Nucleolar protein 16 n=1 Tax=Eumeta variegata TaxID=151549 RepID=A0A4C1U836_EUMVA|nr:Nucleolar protein 16 [Eumeta japonica]